MITPAYAAAMARYNTWQNANLYSAAATLSDDQRMEERGAFFGSIHKTFNHLIWADRTWIARLGVGDMPKERTIADGLASCPDFETQWATRKALDGTLESWASGLTEADVAGELTFHSVSYRATLTQPRAAIIMHLFNHQTHHRGQVHAILTGLGARPGPTDIPAFPEMWDGLF